MQVQAWAAWLCRAAALAVGSRVATEVGAGVAATALAVAVAWASSSMAGGAEGTRRCAAWCSVSQHNTYVAFGGLPSSAAAHLQMNVHHTAWPRTAQDSR